MAVIEQIWRVISANPSAVVLACVAGCFVGACCALCVSRDV